MSFGNGGQDARLALSSPGGRRCRITVADDAIAPASFSGIEARVRALHELNGRLSAAEFRHSDGNRNLPQ
jgi:hypothetical protein